MSTLVKLDKKYKGNDPASIFDAFNDGREDDEATDDEPIGNESELSDQDEDHELSHEDGSEYSPKESGEEHIPLQEENSLDNVDKTDNRIEDVASPDSPREQHVRDLNDIEGPAGGVEPDKTDTTEDKESDMRSEDASRRIQRVYRGRVGRKRAAAAEMRRERELLKSRQRQERIRLQQEAEEERSRARQRERAEVARAEDEAMRIAAERQAQRLEGERAKLEAEQDEAEQDEAEQGAISDPDLSITTAEELQAGAVSPSSPSKSPSANRIVKVQPSPPPRKNPPPRPVPPPPVRSREPLSPSAPPSGEDVEEELNEGTAQITGGESIDRASDNEAEENDSPNDIVITYKPHKLPPIRCAARVSTPTIDDDEGDDQCFGEERPATSSSMAGSEEGDIDPEAVPAQRHSCRSDPATKANDKVPPVDYENELDSEIANIERMLNEAQEVFGRDGPGEDNEYEDMDVTDDDIPGEPGIHEEQYGYGEEMPYSEEDEDDDEEAEVSGEDESAQFTDSLEYSRTWQGSAVPKRESTSPVKYAPTIRDLQAVSTHASPTQKRATREPNAEQVFQNSYPPRLSLGHSHGSQLQPEEPGPSLSTASSDHSNVPPPLPMAHLHKMQSTNDAVSAVTTDNRSHREVGRANSEEGYSARSKGKQQGDRFHAMAIARRHNAALMIQRVHRGRLARKQAAIRREKMKVRFACPNCGMLEQGGLYCKRCGRRVGKPAPRRNDKASRKGSAEPSAVTNLPGGRNGRQEDSRQHPPRGPNREAGRRGHAHIAAAEVVTEEARERQRGRRVGKKSTRAEEPSSSPADHMENLKEKSRSDRQQQMQEEVLHDEAQQCAAVSDKDRAGRHPVKGQRRVNKVRSTVDEEEQAMAEAEAALLELDRKYEALASHKGCRNPSQEQATPPQKNKKKSLQKAKRENSTLLKGQSKHPGEKILEKDMPHTARDRAPELSRIAESEPVEERSRPSHSPAPKRDGRPLPCACDVPLPFQNDVCKVSVLGGGYGDCVGYLGGYAKKGAKKGGRSAGKKKPPPMPVDLRSSNGLVGDGEARQQGRVASGGYQEDFEESRSLPPIPGASGRGDGGGGEHRGHRRHARRRGRGNELEMEEARTQGTMSAPSRLKKEADDGSLRLPAPVKRSYDYENQGQAAVLPRVRVPVQRRRL